MSKYLLFLTGEWVVWKRPKTSLYNIQMAPYINYSLLFKTIELKSFNLSFRFAVNVDWIGDWKTCCHPFYPISLNNVIVRPTKIMNRADKNWPHF